MRARARSGGASCDDPRCHPPGGLLAMGDSSNMDDDIRRGIAASVTPEGQFRFGTRMHLLTSLRDSGMIERGSEPGYARFCVNERFWHRYLRAGFAPFRDRFSAEGRI